MKKYMSFALIFALCIGSGVFSTPVLAFSAPDEKAVLPDMMSWVAYEVGSAGYADAAGIANALTQMFGTQIRIIPADPSVARMLFLKNRIASYALVADEAYFASHGLFDFGERAFGPQNLRVVLGKPNCIAFAVTRSSGLQTIEDLRGRRLGIVPGNTSHIIKAKSFLAFGDMTFDDVEIVTMSSYSASLRGLLEGTVDVVIASTTAATLYELDASPLGVSYIDMPADDIEGWNRLMEVTAWQFPHEESRGAGMRRTYTLGGYTYPQIIVYADMPAEEIYEVAKAIHQAFELYRDMNPLAADWAIELSSRFPQGAPFHEGAIRFLKEMGLWTDEHQKWNDEAIAAIEASKAAWELVIAEADEQGIPDSRFNEFWTRRRGEILGK